MKNTTIKTSSLFKKISLFVFGLFMMAFGVALSIKADLGVSPISCVPYVYFRFQSSMTMGQLTILLNIALMLLQIALLRRNYRFIQLIQLPAVIVFGYFIDLALAMLGGLTVSSYTGRILWCLLGCVILAFGVFLEVKSDLTYLPGEGVVAAISETFQKEFGKVKVGVDTALVIAGVLSSFVLMHRLEGVREGTIVAALSVGFIVRFFNCKLAVVEQWLE